MPVFVPRSTPCAEAGRNLSAPQLIAATNSSLFQCLALLSVLGSGKIFFPGSADYTSSVSTYWAQQQAQLAPRCIVTPRSAEDVATAVRTLTTTAESPGVVDGSAEEAAACLFAIRSGGHLPVPGAANVVGGVVLDLRLLNNVEVNLDKTLVSIGAGATWGKVYSALDPLGLNVAGGRVAQVGVGGLATGGGISFASPRYGWTCDTVVSYQVVLADGSIVNASADENSDLRWALRGGSNSFGVVTALSMETFELGQVWGGSVYYDMSTIDDHLKSFVEINSPDRYDEHASLITSFGFAAGQGAAVVNNIEYTKAEENPAVFASLMEIPSIYSSMRLDSMANIAEEQGSLSRKDMRQLFVTITHASTVPMVNSTYLHWNRSLSAIESIPGIVWSISLEPLPPAIYARAARRSGSQGRNALGLDGRASGALVVTLLSATWAEAADDERVEAAARDMMAAIESDARAMGAHDPFIYLNYAAPWQDPIASYGEEVVRQLQEVRKRVDPNGVFTRQVPGGFKVPRRMEQ